MCGSTCFGHLSSNHHKRTTALWASGSTVGTWWLECFWSWSGRITCQTMTNNVPRSNGRTRGSLCSCTLMMMGGETPETCWATHKHEVINSWNCCILLVDLFELSLKSVLLTLIWIKCCVSRVLLSVVRLAQSSVLLGAEWHHSQPTQQDMLLVVMELMAKLSYSVFVLMKMPKHAWGRDNARKGRKLQSNLIIISSSIIENRKCNQRQKQTVVYIGLSYWLINM
jgi:hypothetical protein